MKLNKKNDLAANSKKENVFYFISISACDFYVFFLFFSAIFLW